MRGWRSVATSYPEFIADLAAHVDKRACYFAVLVLVRSADDPQPLIAEGRWNGEVIATPRGANGFGYDPHFLDAATGLTAAELQARDRLLDRPLAAVDMRLPDRLVVRMQTPAQPATPTPTLPSGVAEPTRPQPLLSTSLTTSVESTNTSGWPPSASRRISTPTGAYCTSIEMAELF